MGDGGRSGSFPEEVSKLSLSAATFILNQMLNNKCSKSFQWNSIAHIESSVNSSANVPNTLHNLSVGGDNLSQVLSYSLPRERPPRAE